jgi:hypothetical protein
VGVSIGVERVFTIMEAKAAQAHGGLKRTPVTVLVASIPSKRFDMNVERMKVLRQLWKAGFAAEMVQASDPKLQKQVTVAAETEIPFLIVLGEDELDRGEVQVKNMTARTADMVKQQDVIEYLTQATGRGAITSSAAAAVTAQSATSAAPANVPITSVTASTTSSATVASSTASVSFAVPAGAGVVLEGANRTAGRFYRPAPSH